ncbi:MAG: class I SAM-dependent methyltransferase [Spirochaetales bacterium]|nr:class I SAM-dependent methyltransferase [Spirochaetales bacterium]
MTRDLIVDKEKITFTKEKETLFIPLYGKAMESKKANAVLIDKKAEEIIELIDYDFSKLKIPQKTDIMMGLRAKKIDDYTKEFLLRNPRSIVLHLGCGLDSRYSRIGNNNADWYELDFPEVIDIKKRFFKETGRLHFLASSVTELEWICHVQESEGSVLVLAEGLLMYLNEDEIRSLMEALSERFSHYRFIFDCFSKLTAKYAGGHPSLKRTGAVLKWGIDDPLEMERWDKRIHFIEEWGFSDSDEISKLSFGNRFMFRFMGYFKAARRAHRILVFDIDRQ